MDPLNIIAFFDGTLGHEKQTKGILRALAAMTSINVSHKGILHSQPLLEKSWNYLTVSLSSSPSPKEGSSIDLIIGTGSQTHIPMLVYNKAHGAKIVTCMTPNFPLTGKMDLCFVPRHDNTRADENIFFTTGPPNTAIAGADHDVNCGLILVGGLDPKSHAWNSADVMARIKSIIEIDSQKKWTISSSPRTPTDMIVLLEKCAAEYAHVEFFKSTDTPDGWIEAEYAKNKTVWVTADSISMVYEALSAGCDVGILPVEWIRESSKFIRSENYLIQNQRVTSYDQWLSVHQMIKGTPLDEASRCAREILQRWWPNRLK
jgi:mitochondrial fission protein ELM1